MRTADICPTCSTFSNALCTLYNGPYLSTLEISTLDSLETVIQKIETFAAGADGATPNLQAVTDVGAITTNTITIPSLKINTTAGITVGVGELAWNIDEQTYDLGVTLNSTLQLGQEDHYQVTNSSGAAIPDGTPVMAIGTLGASGKILIAPMDGTNIAYNKYFLGVTTEAIPNGSNGKVTKWGKINTLDTSGTPYGEVWVDEQIIWISNTTPGYLTNVEPTTGLKLAIGFVIRAHATTGILHVRATAGSSIRELHDVNLTGLTNNSILKFNTTSQNWEVGAVVSPTGLEAINEGSGIGWRLIGRDPAYFAPIGTDAIDLSVSTTLGSVNGASGEASFNMGGDSVVSGYGAFNMGWYNNVLSTASSVWGFYNSLAAPALHSYANGLYNENEAPHGFTFGYYNRILGTSDYSFSFGTRNTITNGVSNFIFGGYNESYTFANSLNMGRGNFNRSTGGVGGAGSSMLGIALDSSDGVGGMVIGTANTPVVNSTTGTALTDSLLTVGNGTFTTPNNATWVAVAPSNAFKVYRGGEVTAPSLTIAKIDAEATGKVLVTREWVNAQSSPTPSLQAVTDAGNTTTLNIDVASVNNLKLFAQTSIDTQNIAIGFDAMQNNLGYDSIGIGAYALQYNVFPQVCAFGESSLRYNIGNHTSGVGFESLANNVGAFSNGIGSAALRENMGSNVNGIGNSVLEYNLGNWSVGVGNTNLQYNEKQKNTAIGSHAYSTFLENVAGAKTFDSTDINTTTDRITIPAHGFGSTGNWVILKFTKASEGYVGGLSNGEFYQFKIIDANTLGFNIQVSVPNNILHGANIYDAGEGTGHIFTPQFSYENTTSLGAYSQPTKSNQVVLGDSNVTEVKTDGTYVSGGYTVATLPTGVTGARAYVTDATATTFYSVVVGGGANVVPVFYNGTNWVIA